MEKGFKHLIECRCILPQFKTQPNPVLHKFVVFSVMCDDQVLVKFDQCNNCGIVHKIVDVCKSEILNNRENAASILSIDEIKATLPESLKTLLESYDVDRATFELASWIIENQRWGEIVIIASELIDGVKQGKYVRIIGENLFKVESFMRNESLG